MLLHDRVGDRQPEAGALADILRGEERIEDLRLHVFRHARPIVGDLEHDRVAIEVVPGADDERAAAVRADHGLLGVDDQVEQHLLNLMRIGERLRQAGGERLDGRDVVDALLVRAQRQRFANHLIEVDHRARRVALAREGQQVADDLGGALRLAEDGLEAAARVVVGGPLRQTLGPGEDGRERVVELVRDAGDRLTERRELLGLEQLVVEVAGLIFETLTVADVAHERLDAQAVAHRLRVRGDFDPHRGLVGAPQAQQVVAHRAVALQPAEEAVARLRIDEVLELERPHVGLGGFDAEAEHQLEMRIRGQRLTRRAVDRADVDTFVDRLEQPGKGFSGRLRTRHRGCRLMRMRRRRAGRILGPVFQIDGAPDVGDRRTRCVQSASPPPRRRCRCRSRCRADSTRGVPSALRRATKQSSLLPWPLRSQPQKQGMCLSTSGCRAANS